MTVTRVPTFCFQCNAGPDLLKVQVEDGVAIGIEPNCDATGFHPADGKVCVKAYGLVDKAYNPNRILTPMKRTNPKKGRDQDPGFVPIGWDEAMELISSRLNAVRAKGMLDESGYPRVAMSFGEAGIPVSHMGSFPAFLTALGPVDFGIGAGQGIKCYHSEHMFGEYWHRAFTVTADVPHCDYILAFGANTDASSGVAGVNRHGRARARGMKRVQFEPHLSVTGAHATEWIPIRPKTDAAVMYALIHALVFDHGTDRLDVEFLKQRTASPYLIGPNGWYLRDPASAKPLMWDATSARPVTFDTAGTDPVLETRDIDSGIVVAEAIEIGVDGERFEHRSAKIRTAFDAMKDHLRPCTPEWAEAISGTPAATIRRIAGEFLAHARIGATIEIDGRVLPHRPVAVMLGKTVNNGWGGYNTCWARTVLACLVGALEVPGGTIGTTISINRGFDRLKTVLPGPDGFMKQTIGKTDRENWSKKPKSRNLYNVLTPLCGDSGSSQALGPAHLPWLFMDEPPEGFPPQSIPDIWFVYRTNPPMSSWDGLGVTEKMARFPFIVAFAYTRDESNHFADVILPDAMDLESTQLIRIGGTSYMEQFWKHEGFGLRQAACAPRGESRDFTEIATELAVRTGVLELYNRLINKGLLGVKLRGENFDFSLAEGERHSVEAVWDAVCRAASVQLTRGSDINGLDWFKANGFKLRPFSQLNWYMYPTMVDQGIRFELPYQEELTRLGRQLGNRLHENGITWWDAQLAEYEPLPTWHDFPAIWENDGGWSADRRFWLVASTSMQYAFGATVSQELVRELARNVGGHRGMVINAGVAAQMGIRDGDMVEIASPMGLITAPAELREGIRPDTILAIGRFGQWATPVAKDMGLASFNTLAPISLTMTDATGSGADLVKVSMRKAGG